MVVFVDLDDTEEPPERPPHWLQHQHLGVTGDIALRSFGGDGRTTKDSINDGPERENPNREKAVTKALGCYPYTSLTLLVIKMAGEGITDGSPAE
jgi:hypothetical protein